MGAATGLIILVALLVKECLGNGVSYGSGRSWTVQRNVDRRNGLCALLIRPWGYDCQEFLVQTEDGFKLGVQRISSRGPKRGTVFLYHGVLIGGDIWVLNPPNQSLGFILADKGYDVWIGNTRTTTFSCGHVSYKKEDQGFWNWSVDELVEYDLSSMMEFVYSETKKKILYIGYSEGTQAALAALTQGWLINIIEKVVLLAPIAYLDHFTTPIGLLAERIHLDFILDELHVYEFSLSYRTKQGKELIDFLCSQDDTMCYKDVVALLTGKNCCINDTRRPLYDQFELQDTATKNMNHFVQQYRSHKFRKFDYGSEDNMKRYGSTEPPLYDLKKIPPTLPLMLANGPNDALSAPKDVQRLVSELRGKPITLLVPNYAHFDFVLATNAKELIYDKIISFFES